MLADSSLMGFIATADPATTRRFYEQTLGLSLLADEPNALVFSANGTPLRIQKVEKAVPPPYTALGWRVADIRGTVSSLMARGVAFQRYAGLSQDDLGIWRAPSGARVAWFKDPEGHVLSLTQF